MDGDVSRTGVFQWRMSWLKLVALLNLPRIGGELWALHSSGTAGHTALESAQHEHPEHTHHSGGIPGGDVLVEVGGIMKPARQWS